MACKCGNNVANFNFRNDFMPPEVIEALYCPICSDELKLDAETMLNDNGWVIEFDMEVAGFYRNRLPAGDAERLSPEILFNEGYATWRGIYPGDHIDSIKERQELTALAKTDPRKYFEEVKNWANCRMARLKEKGWRKAHEG